jgi:hypothetical protein
MATNPNPPAAIPKSEDRTLTRDEWWDLVLGMAGSAKEMFAEVGGSDAWIRVLRDEEQATPAD